MAKGEIPSLAAFGRVRVDHADLDLPGLCLRSEAEPFDFDRIDPTKRRALARGLIGALYTRPAGIGLAAPMVGMLQRIVLVEAGDRLLVMANPEILECSDEHTSEREGNLSLPGVRGPVSRPVRVKVRWQDMNRRAHEEEFDGWTARIVQHEVEILDGRMFCDHVPADELEIRPEPARHAAETVEALTGQPPVDRSCWPGVGLGVVTLPPDLLGLGGSILTRPATPINFAALTPETLVHLATLLLRRQHETFGAGFAAPQAGIGLRMAVVDVEEGQVILIDPEIIERSDDAVTETEGCLSIPGRRGSVTRPEGVRVRNHKIDGEAYELDASGYHARVIQHEIDHLDGVLYPDRQPAGAGLTVTAPEELARQAYKRTGM